MSAQLSIDGTGPTHKPELSQYFTRPRLAERLVEWAVSRCSELADLRAGLEPSAGGGAFVGPMLQRFDAVTAHELDPGWAAHLIRAYPGARVVEGDYLAARRPRVGPYDLACMNPPYEELQDARHIAKAMDESLRVLALIRTHALHSTGRYRPVWSRLGSPEDPGPWWMSGQVYFISRPFPGAQFEYTAVLLTRHPDETGRTFQPEWWA